MITFSKSIFRSSLLTLLAAGCSSAPNSTATDSGVTVEAGTDAAPTTYDDTALDGPKWVVNAVDCGCKTLGEKNDIPSSCNTSVSPNTIRVHAIDLDATGDSASEISGGLEVIACRGLAYSDRSATTTTTLDLYLPKDYLASDKPRPVVMYTHGGGWWSGSSADVTPQQLAYLAKGYAVVSTNYRLSCYTYPSDPTNPPDYQHACTARDPNDPQWVKFPENLKDLKTAIQWMGLKLPDIVDTSRLIAWGFSAGGHLSALLGTTDGVAGLEGRAGSAVSSKVSAAVVQSPAVDLDYFAHPTAPQHIGPGIDQDPDYPRPNGCPENDDWFNSAIAIRTMVGAEISPPTPQSLLATPTTNLDANDAPLYMLIGSCDATVAYKGNVDWAQQHGSSVLGSNYHFEVAVGAQHGGTFSIPGVWSRVRDFIYDKAPPNK